MGADVKDNEYIHKILIEIGEFKRYQVFMLALLVIPCLLSAGFIYQFMFASATLDYR